MNILIKANRLRYCFLLTICVCFIPTVALTQDTLTILEICDGQRCENQGNIEIDGGTLGEDALVTCIAGGVPNATILLKPGFKAERGSFFTARISSNLEFPLPYIVRTGRTNSEHLDDVKDLSAYGYRIKWVDAKVIHNEVRVSAVYEKLPGSPKRVHEHHLRREGALGFLQRNILYQNTGHRLIHLKSYRYNSISYYTAIWEKSAGPDTEIRYEQSEGILALTHGFLLGPQGFRLKNISSILDTSDNNIYYTTLWEKRENSQYDYGVNLSLEQVEQHNNVCDVLVDADSTYYTSILPPEDFAYHAAVWHQIDERNEYKAEMNNENLRANTENKHFQGYRLDKIIPIAENSSTASPKFWAMWSDRYNETPDQYLVNHLDVIISVYKDHTDSYVPGLTLAVTREGKLAYAKAWGYGNKPHLLDPDGIEASPWNVGRIGSISKWFTGVAITKLYEDGCFSVTPYGNNTDNVIANLHKANGGEWSIRDSVSFPGNSNDFIKNLDIEHLLQHRNTVWYDPKPQGTNYEGGPFYSDPNILYEDLPTLFQIAFDDTVNGAGPNPNYTYNMEDPTPTINPFPPPPLLYPNHHYNGFGFMLLGRVIENRMRDQTNCGWAYNPSGTYETFLQDEILEPIGITRVQLAAEDALGVNGLVDREWMYYDDEGKSPFEGNTRRLDAGGGLIGSVIDLVRFGVHTDGEDGSLGSYGPADIITSDGVEYMKVAERGVFGFHVTHQPDPHWFGHSGVVNYSARAFLFCANDSTAGAPTGGPEDGICFAIMMNSTDIVGDKAILTAIADMFENNSYSNWPEYDLFDSFTKSEVDELEGSVTYDFETDTLP